MKVIHKVSFPGGREYEQYSATFELEAVDVSPDALSELNLIETLFAFNTLVAYQGVLFQYLKGYIDKEMLDAQSKRLFGMLTPKLEKVVKRMLTENGNSKEPAKKKTTRTVKKKQDGTKETS